MFRLMIQKLLHKKWMVFCLLIGNVLLIATVVSHPMYRSASFKKMLTDEFKAYEEDNVAWPAILQMGIVSPKNDGTDLFSKLTQFTASSNSRLGLDVKHDIAIYSTSPSGAESIINANGLRSWKPSITTMTDLAQHVKILTGENVSDTITADGGIPAIISEATMVKLDILMGETVEFQYIFDNEGNPVRITIVGVFGKDDNEDDYWVVNPEDYETNFFIDYDVFSRYFLGENSENYNLRGEWIEVYDYTTIRPAQVASLMRTGDQINNDPNFSACVKSTNFMDVLNSYNAKAKKIEATLIILQIPVLLLLCAFLYMISGQMLLMEQNEISLLKSRGAKRIQILGLYIMQSSFLALISMVAGLPLGRLVCSILGSSSAFLEFGAKRNLEVEYSLDVLLYGLGAALLSIIMTVIPVIKYSGVTIVSLKRSRSRNKRPIAAMLIVDALCLGISFYGYYTFRKNEEQMLLQVLAGENLDPLLYFSSSLFIIGMGLLYLILQPYLVKLLYVITKRFQRPAAYASFLETIRNGSKQSFIMLFMILTVALGIFHASVARTIIANAENNKDYVDGTDFILEEKWESNQALKRVDPSVPLEYYEPDFEQFKMIDGVENVARVYKKQQTAKIGGTTPIDVTLMGIIPKEFASVTTLDDDLLHYDYYDYLNVLASKNNAIIVSENFLKEKDLRLGDTITVFGINGDAVRGYIYGFVEYWPGYLPVTYETAADGSLTKQSEYLIIANLNWLQDSLGIEPYQVWFSLKEGEGPDGIYNFVNEENLPILSYVDRNLDKENIRRDTLFQGTNGILTMSFIIILLLCGVGYLIYWIMSIRSRELLFGVLRAMGMRRGEIYSMLCQEQIYSGVFSILAGAGIGIIANKLFVPMIQNAYAATDQVLPMELISSRSDMVELFTIIALVLLLCVAVLIRIVARMNITKALKLGED